MDEIKYLEVEVEVNITLSKTIKVMVSNYEAEPDYDDEGNCSTMINIPKKSVLDAIKEQIYLPQNAGKILEECKTAWGNTDLNKKIKDLSNWNLSEINIDY